MSKNLWPVMKAMNLEPWYAILPASFRPVIHWQIPLILQNQWRRGWLTYGWECPACGTQTKLMARIGVYCDHECKQCGYAERACIMVQGDLPSDGVWL